MTSHHWNPNLIPIIPSQQFFDGTAAFVASMLFGKLVPQTVYQAHSPDGGQTCFGPDCFFYSHLIQIGFNMLAIVLILVVTKRTLGVYQAGEFDH